LNGKGKAALIATGLAVALGVGLALGNDGTRKQITSGFSKIGKR
jgi:hypothetical protein